MGGPSATKIYFTPVACPKANVDLEKACWLLSSHGFEIADDPGDARIAVVLGCAFIDDAKSESIDDILTVVELKKKGPLEYVVVGGCLPEKYAEELGHAVQEVDALIGNSALNDLPSIINDLVNGNLTKKVWRGHAFEAWQSGCRRYRARSQQWTRTVMICDGCDNACTYCSISVAMRSTNCW